MELLNYSLTEEDIPILKDLYLNMLIASKIKNNREGKRAIRLWRSFVTSKVANDFERNLVEELYTYLLESLETLKTKTYIHVKDKQEEISQCGVLSPEFLLIAITSVQSQEA